MCIAARTQKTIAELLDEFEKLSPEERRRDIEAANAFLHKHGVERLRRMEELQRLETKQCGSNDQAHR
jgi:hypothetical protein